MKRRVESVMKSLLFISDRGQGGNFAKQFKIESHWGSAGDPSGAHSRTGGPCQRRSRRGAPSAKEQVPASPKDSPARSNSTSGIASDNPSFGSNFAFSCAFKGPHGPGASNAGCEPPQPSKACPARTHG